MVLFMHRRAGRGAKGLEYMPMNTRSQVFTALVCLAAAGCASTPVDTAPMIARAEAMIDTARSSGAREFEPEALDAAEDKLTQARLKAQAGDDEEAARLAQQARLDAEYASARAEYEESNVALREIQETIAALQEEISRTRP